MMKVFSKSWYCPYAFNICGYVYSVNKVAWSSVELMAIVEEIHGLTRKIKENNTVIIISETVSNNYLVF
jgi:hypothetical protein